MNTRFGAGRGKRLAVALAVIPLLALAGCGDDGRSASTGATRQAEEFLPAGLTGAAPSQLSIGYSAINTPQFLPTFIAFGAGYYDQVAKRFGTTITSNTYENGAIASAAFFGGSDQFILVSAVSNIVASSAGQDILGVLNAQVGLGLTLIGNKKFEAERGGDITKYADGVWCQNSPSSASHYGLVLAAELNDLDVGGLDLVTIAGASAEVPSVQAGRCDLLSSTPTGAAAGAVRGVTYTVLNTADPAVSVSVTGDVLGVPLNTTTAFAEQYPELTQAIVDATLKGLLLVQANIDNPDMLYGLLPEENRRTMSKEEFTVQLELLKNAFNAKTNNGTFTDQAITDSVWFSRALGSLKPEATYSPTQSYTNRFAVQAHRDLGLPLEESVVMGPEQLSSTVGDPTAEAAAAYGTITGSPAPANSGPSRLGAALGSE